MGTTTPTMVLSPAQTRLLASPPRLEIVEAFGALGRASARELAAHLGRSPGAVYHHVRTLEQAGLVREVARRAGSRRPEAVYAATGRRFAVAAGPTSADRRPATATLRAVLRQAARDADRAFAGEIEAKGRFHGLQLSAALLPADVQRVLALLHRVEAILRKASRQRSRAGEAFYRWTSLFVPIARSRS
jgi:DNA-binding transcriptional ArsR family regulator